MSGTLMGCWGVPGTWGIATYFYDHSTQLFDWGMLTAAFDLALNDHMNTNLSWCSDRVSWATRKWSCRSGGRYAGRERLPFGKPGREGSMDDSFPLVVSALRDAERAGHRAEGLKATLVSAGRVGVEENVARVRCAGRVVIPRGGTRLRRRRGMLGFRPPDEPWRREAALPPVDPARRLPSRSRSPGRGRVARR